MLKTDQLSIHDFYMYIFCWFLWTSKSQLHPLWQAEINAMQISCLVAVLYFTFSFNLFAVVVFIFLPVLSFDHFGLVHVLLK